MAGTLLRATSHFCYLQLNILPDKKLYLVFLHCSICSAIKHFGGHVDKQACLHHTYHRETKNPPLFQLLKTNYVISNQPNSRNSILISLKHNPKSTIRHDPEPVSFTSYPYNLQGCI